MPAKISAAIRQRAARIKLFLCDVDGSIVWGVQPSRLRFDASRGEHLPCARAGNETLPTATEDGRAPNF